MVSRIQSCNTSDTIIPVSFGTQNFLHFGCKTKNSSDEVRRPDESNAS